MIELKNKIYNSNRRKRQMYFNRFMELKKIFRLKFEKLIPLSENEKILYKYKNTFNEKIEKPKNNKYLAFNKRIHLLSVIPKDEINDFYISYCNLVKKNPSKNIFSTIILDEKQKESILNFGHKVNSGGWSNLGYITPDSENLKDIVDYVHIFIFSLSDDYIGIDLTATLNSNFNDNLNKFMISDIKSEVNYHKYYIGGKKHVYKNTSNKNTVRKEKLDDYLLEIKMRLYDFFKEYFNLFPIEGKAPITIDEYSTNYDFNSKDDYLLRCYDFFSFETDNIYKDMSIIINHPQNTKDIQTFEKVDFICDCGYKNDNIRSMRVLFNLSKNQKDNFFEQSSFLQLIKITIYFFYNIELEKVISKKRESLNKYLKNKNSKIYDEYININQKIYVYDRVIGKMNIKNRLDGYENEKIKKVLKYQKERYNDIIKDNNKTDKDFSNLLTAISNKSATKLATISIVIAILSLLVTMYFSIISYINQNQKNQENLDNVCEQIDDSKNNNKEDTN